MLRSMTGNPSSSLIKPINSVRVIPSRMSSLTGGEHVRLERVAEQIEINLEALAYLSANGFVPGADARVASRAPDGTLTLDLGERSIALGPALTRQLYVSSGR